MHAIRELARVGPIGLRRSARLLAVAPILAALLLASPGSVGATQPSKTSHQAKSCPGTPIPEGKVGLQNKNRRSHSTLVPRGATSVVLCRYFGTGEEATKGDRRGVGHLARQRVIDAHRLVSELEDGFRALPHQGHVGIESCPFDNGARLDAFFRYRGEPTVIVAVDLRGCEFVTNGDAPAGLLSTRLRSRLRSLTKAL